MAKQYSGVIVLLLLSACSTKMPPANDDVRFFLTDATAERLPVPELIRSYAANDDVAALYASARQCPSESARADSLLTGLLSLSPTQERTRDYALYWSALLATCGDARIVAWYRESIAHPRDDLTFELLTKALLRLRDPASIQAVKRAAFDTANYTEARNAMLKLLVEDLNYSGAQRLELMVESYREAGEIPTDFIVDQAARVWLHHVPNWRETLLAELVASPGKRGGAALLLALARETERYRPTSRWLVAWETALVVLETHPESSAELKAMVPIARKFSQ